MTDKGKILVVDDDRLVLATLTHGLLQAGYDVIDTDNGDDAILLAREHRPDLALLDIRMEGKSGFDVAAYLREFLHMPFMFLSAFADDETVAKVKELGAVDYLVKPLEVKQILPAVEAAFAALHAKLAKPTALVTLASAEPMSPIVAMAVGVLMHRNSLARVAAHELLRSQAHEDGQSIEHQAQRLIDAVELLARPPRA
ncbi:MAG: response regulator [Burkholderiales bacterium]